MQRIDLTRTFPRYQKTEYVNEQFESADADFPSDVPAFVTTCAPLWCRVQTRDQEYAQQKPKLLPSIVSLMRATDYLLPKIKYPECKICSRSPVKMRAFIPLKTGGISYATA